MSDEGKPFEEQNPQVDDEVEPASRADNAPEPLENTPRSASYSEADEAPDYDMPPPHPA